MNLVQHPDRFGRSDLADSHGADGRQGVSPDDRTDEPGQVVGVADWLEQSD